MTLRISETAEELRLSAAAVAGGAQACSAALQA
jgi:hypothetical protein